MILDLISGLGSITEAPEPKGVEEVHPGEEVKGIVGPQARKLWALICQRVDLAVNSLPVGPPRGVEDRMAAVESCRQLVAQASLLKDLFWREVREETGVNGNDIVNRAGWQVVEDREAKERLNVPEIIVASFLKRFDGECDCPECTARREAAQKATP